MKTLQQQIAEQLNNRKAPFLYVNMDYVLQDGTLQAGRDFLEAQKLFKYLQEDQKYYEEKGNKIISVRLEFYDEKNLDSY
jgi:hypothetical protein